MLSCSSPPPLSLVCAVTGCECTNTPTKGMGYNKKHDTTSSISKTSKYLSAASPHPVTLPTIGTMNTQVGSMYASGDVAASSLAAALSVSVAVIVIAAITTVVVAALVCMKVKTIRAGDNGRELPVDSEQTHACM